MQVKKIVVTLLACLAACSANAAADRVAVDVVVPDVRIRTGPGGSSVAANTAGFIDPEADMDGVAVINGEVFIDGEKLPKGKTSHKGRKSGKIYQIKWGPDGNVAIQQK